MLLHEARQRTLALVAPVCEEDLNRVHHPLMSPLVWDLGHIAAFEDLWLGQRAGGLEPLRPDLADVYDAAETPRPGRADLPYLRCADAIDFMRQVRERALDVLETADVAADGEGINAGGFVWEMLVQHEHQHNETMLQTLQLAERGTLSPTRRPLPPAPAAGGPASVRVEAGPFVMGAPEGGFTYDNERPTHELVLPAFEIDRTPVTNGAYLEFVEGGGYARSELWTEDGWAWREAEGVERPLFWMGDGQARSFDRVEPLDPSLPVMHVSWFEADAYAHWAGKRLPTEAEWEKAACCLPDGGKLLKPWGGAGWEACGNLDQSGFGPAPAGAYPEGASPCGALGMIGDCWEWTAGAFAGYPGFRAFPYREYSEDFFGGGYRVLRGGSWATRPRVARPTFRNWDHPQRRQIFAGFRCVTDVER